MILIFSIYVGNEDVDLRTISGNHVNPTINSLYAILKYLLKEV